TLCKGNSLNLSVQRIEQAVRPTAQQQSAFDDLKETAQQAADRLQSSCPIGVPQAPLARLETGEKRVKAMAHAMGSFCPALGYVYASLNDEQKARFNTMGPPRVRATRRSERQPLNSK